MPNLYYVKSGGTAGNTNNGRVAGPTPTYRTGTFAAMGAGNYYDNVGEVFGISAGTGTDPVSGDIILVSSAHAYTASGIITWTPGNTEWTEAIRIISVDDSNADQYLRSATEDTGLTNSDFTINLGSLSVQGMDFKWSDNLTMSLDACIDCTFTPEGSTDLISITNNRTVRFIDCTFDWSNSDNTILTTDAGFGFFYNCTFSGSGATWNTSGLYASSAFDAGGGTFRFYGCDLSDVDVALVSSTMCGDSTIESTFLEYKRCQFDTSYSFLGATITNGIRVEASGCGSGAEAEYQFFVEDRFGSVEESSSTYRDQSVAWPVSGSKTCLVIDTTTAAISGLSSPFMFELPSRFVALSSTATDLITIYLSCNNTLTDADIWVEACYPDDASFQVPIFYSTIAPDIYNGTTLTSDTGSTWTSGGTNKYRIEIDTTDTGKAGNDAVPLLRVYVAKQATIYIDSQVDLS